jgi:SAM-dependent methyltransferase
MRSRSSLELRDGEFRREEEQKYAFLAYNLHKRNESPCAPHLSTPILEETCSTIPLHQLYIEWMKTEGSPAISLAALDRSPDFPAIWADFVDNVLTAVVKTRFSPKPAWKDKPFSKTDVSFFSKGLIALQEELTTDRLTNTRTRDYFAHPASRSSYLLFYLPLQAAKFLALFDHHSDALKGRIAQADGSLRILDLGAGPGTASLAFLAAASAYIPKGSKVQLVWLDRRSKIMEDGTALLDAFLASQNFDFEVRLEKKYLDLSTISALPASDFILAGHVMNELLGKAQDQVVKIISETLGRANAPELIVVEPAFRSSAQRLSANRNTWLSGDAKLNVIGPCLHRETCPLTASRDWCHFSVPAQIPGRWFAEFSKALGGERDWLKFAYIWISPNMRLKKTASEVRRVVSDPIQTPDGRKNLLCAPTQLESHISEGRGYLRGSLFPVNSKTDAHRVHKPTIRKART